MRELMTDIMKLDRIKREAALIGLSLLFGLAACFIISRAAMARQDETVGHLSERVVRFHILANSDSAEDQRIKLELRDAILFEYGALFSETNDKEEAKAAISARLFEMERFSMDYLDGIGNPQAVKCALVREKFPDRVYGDMFFPAGEYDALRVSIGSAAGQNFWCVMFPPMCFVDAAVAKDEAEGLKDDLSSEEYEMVTGEIKLKSWFMELFDK